MLLRRRKFALLSASSFVASCHRSGFAGDSHGHAVEKIDLPPPRHRVKVGSDEELDVALASAEPGDEITLAKGVYGGPKRDLDLQGIENQPIVIRSEEIGRAQIVRGFNFRKPCKHIILYGIRFEDGGPGAGAILRIRGNNNKVIRCYFKTSFNEGFSRGTIRLSECRDIYIGYCDFTQVQRQWTEKDKLSVINHIQGMHRTSADGSYNVIIERNYFHDMPRQINYRTPWLKVLNNAIGPNQAYIRDTNWVVRYNLFERIDTGFVIWEFKGGWGTAEYNTMNDCNGYVSFRQGPYNVGRGNWMQNTQSWRIHDAHCAMLYNVFINSKILVSAGQISYQKRRDERWQNAYNALLVGNNAPVIVGNTFADETVPALDTTIEGNIGPITYGLEENTHVQAEITSPEPKVVPFKLRPRDVGPLAGLS